MAKRRSVPDNLPVDFFEQPPSTAKFKPLNDEQKDAASVLRSKGGQAILLGPAGTGKTFLVGNLAAEFYSKDPKNKIVLSRPVEPTGRSIGYFPGTLLEKMAPWTAELLGVLVEALGKGTVECGLKETSRRPARIEIVPLEVMRGRSFRDSFVILDEAQNTTPDQAIMFWTRIGEGSNAAMLGDLMQTDIKGRNGLASSVAWAELGAPADVVRLHRIVRDPKVQKWIAAYEEDRETN